MVKKFNTYFLNEPLIEVANLSEEEQRNFQLFFLLPGGQFHQHSTRSFYVSKLRVLLFCAYDLGLYFTGISQLAQKLCVEC